MPSADVAIVAAMPIELDPIRDRITERIVDRGQFRFDRGFLAGRETVLVESGPGEDNAVRACRAILASHQPQWVITAGLAGGLIDGLAVGDVIVAREVVHAESQHPFKFDDVVWPPTTGESKRQQHRLITSTHAVLEESKKRELAATAGAHIVDMESYGVAKWCSQQAVRCISVRSISDSVTDSLPPIVSALIHANPWEQVGRVTGTMLRKPSVIKELWQLRSRALEAADRLAQVVVELVAAINVSAAASSQTDVSAIENAPSDKNCS